MSLQEATSTHTLWTGHAMFWPFLVRRSHDCSHTNVPCAAASRVCCVVKAPVWWSLNAELQRSVCLESDAFVCCSVAPSAEDECTAHARTHARMLNPAGLAHVTARRAAAGARAQPRETGAAVAAGRAHATASARAAVGQGGCAPSSMWQSCYLLSAPIPLLYS